MKNKKEEVLNWLRDDLKQCEIQTSWDWDADYRFAMQFGSESEKKAIKEFYFSKSIAGIKIAVWCETIRGTITRKRLNALNELVAQGYAKKWWSGTGGGGMYEIGVNRVRAYGLSRR